MGEGGVQTLEQTIGCTIAEAFTLFSGRGVLAPNRHPSEKKASQLGGQGELEGGDTGNKTVNDVDDYLRAQGVRRPDRMTALQLPGFSRR